MSTTVSIFKKRKVPYTVIGGSKVDRIRKSQAPLAVLLLGWGSQIRSYVLDQSRVKDLRTGVESGNPTAILDGAIDTFLEESLKQGL